MAPNLTTISVSLSWLSFVSPNRARALCLAAYREGCGRSRGCGGGKGQPSGGREYCNLSADVSSSTVAHVRGLRRGSEAMAMLAAGRWVDGGQSSETLSTRRQLVQVRTWDEAIEYHVAHVARPTSPVEPRSRGRLVATVGHLADVYIYTYPSSPTARHTRRFGKRRPHHVDLPPNWIHVFGIAHFGIIHPSVLVLHPSVHAAAMAASLPQHLPPASFLDLRAHLDRLFPPPPDPRTSFPRSNWRGVALGPPFRERFDNSKRIATAAHCASRSWASDAPRLDHDGVVLAIADKALEL